jgi:hypothetical protein
MLEAYRPERCFKNGRCHRLNEKRPEGAVNHFRMTLMVGLEQFGRLLSIVRAISYADGAALQLF